MANVIHIRSTTGFYGAEKVLLNLLPEINKQANQFSVSLFVIEGEGEDSKRLGRSLEHSSVKVFSARSQKKIDLLLVKKLRKIIKSDNCKIVHTHDYKSLVHAQIAVIFSEVRIVHHMHGGLNTTGAEKLYSKVENFFINFVSSVFVVSRGVKCNVWIKPPLGISFIPNGVYLPDNEIKAAKKAQKKMLIVARISAEKNHLLAVDIINELKHREIDVLLDVVGDGPLLIEVKERVTLLGLEESVKFHGFVTNPETFYKKADILIICSKTEGLPMNLLEALSYGVPVVSTAVGEIPDILNNGNCGLIASDNAKDFADKIETLIADDRRFEMMRINALNTIEKKFSVKSQASLVIEKYRGILTHYHLAK